MVRDIPDAVPRKTEIHILVIGPSWIVGMLPTYVQKHVEREMSTSLNAPVKLDVVAESGKGTLWMASQIKSKVEAHPTGYYNYAIFFPGRNDIGSNGVGAILSNITTSLALLRSVSKVFMFNLQYSEKRLFPNNPQLVGKIDRVNRGITEDVVQVPNLHLLDLYSYTKEHHLGYPLHPSARAYSGLLKWTLDIVVREIKSTATNDTRSKPERLAYTGR